MDRPLERGTRYGSQLVNHAYRKVVYSSFLHVFQLARCVLRGLSLYYNVIVSTVACHLPAVHTGQSTMGNDNWTIALLQVSRTALLTLLQREY